ncbi:tumor necrosis factor receptor superfamily member 5-like, partial [Scophthalmus maximus]|uniref:tumor necrosis factor receptor superfamily member 5-like n=1 Tax=Scophthalmus maximus TaxID=52904 RepID=UPI001FA8D906
YVLVSVYNLCCTGTALTDTECSDCSDGTFSNGTSTSCQPPTQCESQILQLIKPGTVSTDAECGEDYDSTIVVAIVVSFLLICVVLLFLLFFFWKNKRRLFGKIRSAAIPTEVCLLLSFSHCIFYVCVHCGGG